MAGRPFVVCESPFGAWSKQSRFIQTGMICAPNIPSLRRSIYDRRSNSPPVVWRMSCCRVMRLDTTPTRSRMSALGRSNPEPKRLGRRSCCRNRHEPCHGCRDSRHARQQQRICVTLDADFHTHLAVTNAATPSVIRIRIE